MNLAGIDDRVTYYNCRYQLWEFLKSRLQAAARQRHLQRQAIATPEEHQADIQTFRSAFLKQIGGLPSSPSTLLHTVTGEIPQEGFSIQKLLLETRPGVKATAHFYTPKLTEGEKAPAVLLLCGHSHDGKSVERYQIIARKLVATGVHVLILDPTGQGERLNYYHAESRTIRIRSGTGDHEYNGPQCLLLGHSLIRYMLHDAIRAVDFLEAHPQVDSERIGITGSSGGGMQTSLMLLVEPRLAAAAPCTFVTSLQAIFDSGYGQDAEQIWPGFSGSGYDHIDLLSAFAPKPLTVLSTTFDFFPIEGTRESIKHAKASWRLYGKEENLAHVEDRSVHRYTDALGDAAAEFFRRVFQLSPCTSLHPGEPLPVARLWVTQSGQVLGDDPKAKTIFDENQSTLPKRPDRAAAMQFLQGAVFKQRCPVELNLRITLEIARADLVALSGFWWSQHGLLNSGILIRAADAPKVPKVPKVPKAPQGVTIALWEDGSRAIAQHDAWIRREAHSGRAVLVLNVSGMGPLEPYAFNSETDPKTYHGAFFRIADDLISLGDSFAALRIYDVLRSLETLPHWGDLDAADVRLYLNGRYGIYGALASVLEPRLAEARWVSPLLSYAELLRTRYYNDRDVKSLILPGLLSHADWIDLYRGQLS